MKRLLIVFIVLFVVHGWVSAQTETPIPTVTPIIPYIGKHFDFPDTGLQQFGLLEVTGTWTNQLCGPCYGGYIHRSTDGTATIYFAGQYLIIYSNLYSTNDDIMCCVYTLDDEFLSCSALNTYTTGSTEYFLPFVCPNHSRNALDYGIYKAVLERWPEEGQGNYISIDSFIVLDAAERIATPEQTETPESTAEVLEMTPDGATIYATVSADGIDQIVAFRYQVDAGQVMMVILLAGVLIVLLVMLVANLRKRAPEP